MTAPETRFAVLIFTDIVGSTELKTLHGVPAYREALGVHNRHFEGLAAASPGFRILQNMGDGYFAEASGVVEAVRFALLFQQAMREGPWGEVTLTTRVGIHAGEVTVLDSEGGSGIVAPAADMAARVMGLALGGQILLTRMPFDEARHFIREHPAVAGREMPPLQWLAHGPYRIKGCDEPLEIFEVGAEDLAPLAPPPDGEKAKRVIRPGEEETLGWRPAAGLEIPGRPGWHLIARLGEGGFGEVWSGEHAKLHQRRAFKFCFDDERLRALKREVTLVRLLRSALGDRDDIVHIHEIKLDEPPFYLESDLAPHGNLLQWAAKQGGLGNIPLETRIGLVAHTATALAAAHSIGVLHKDIKPTNILIFDGPNGGPRPRLVDFGIGALADPDALRKYNVTGGGFTRPTIEHSTGTPTYSPPEYLAGRPYTIQGDIYGLGVLLYQLVTAKSDDPLAVGWERDIADPLLREDIALCVDGDPTRRLPSAAELAERLETLDQRRAEIAEQEHLARAEAARAEAESATLAARLRAARFRKLSAAFALLALLAVAAGVFAWLSQRKTATALGEVKAQKSVVEQKNEEVERKIEENYNQIAEAARKAWGAARQALDRDDRGTGLARLAEAQRYNATLPEKLRQPGIGIDAGFCVLQLPTLAPLPVGEPMRHDGCVTSASFSPDGTRVVTASGQNMARMWDAASGKPLGKPIGDGFSFTSASFSPDGTRVVTASYFTAQVWDLTSGKPLGEPMGHERRGVRSVSFSPDGTRVVTASGDNTEESDGMVRVWDAACGKPLGEPMRHELSVTSASFSPDGMRVVTASYDKTARVWDAASGKPLGEPMLHKGRVWRSSFSPDGTRVVTASGDGTARVWDTASGKQVGEPMRHEHYVSSASFSPDGTRVVTSSSDTTARVWDAASGKPVGEPMRHKDRVWSASFSPDGTRVVTASGDNTVRVWDAASGKPLGEPMRHDDRVTSASFSPDCMRVVTASYDNTARVWDAASGKPLGEPMRHEGCVRSASFSPDGTRVVTASGDNTAQVWEAVSRKPLGEPMRHVWGVHRASFSSDGTRVITASQNGTARLWDAVSGKPLGEPMRHEGRFNSASFSPDGTRVLTMDNDKTARLWDAVSGKPVGEPMRHEERVTSASFSPDGTRVVTASGAMARMWDAASGKPLGEPMRYEGRFESASFSPDGTRVLTMGNDKTARLWDAVSGKPLGEPMRHELSVTSASFSPDGMRVVTASGGLMASRDIMASRNMARVWNATSGKPVGEPMRHEERVTSASFSPDGTRVVTASGAMARMWDAASGKPLGEPMRYEGRFESASFSPDGTRVLTMGNDKTARLWDAVSGKPLGEPMRHKDYIFSANFSSDGTRVVTASSDKTARVWDAANGKQLGEPLWHGVLLNASFSADGTRVVTASDDKTARLWELWQASDEPPTPEILEAFAGFKVDADGQIVSVATDDRVSVIMRCLTKPAEGSAVRRLLRWRFSDPSTRTISPNSGITVAEHIEREIDWVVDHPKDDNKIAILRDAYGLDPGHPLIHIAIAAAEDGDDAGRVRADFLREYGLKRLPDDARICAKAARILNRQNDPKRALVAAEKALSLDANNEDACRENSIAGALMSSIPFERDLATALMELPVGQTNSALIMKAGIYQAWLGRDGDYAATCREFLARAEKEDDPAFAERAAKLCSIRQSADAEAQRRAVALARRAVELGKDNNLLPWYDLALGMVEFRNGRDEEAAAALERVKESGFGHNPLQGTARVYHAMCLLRQKNAEAAKVKLNEAEQLMRPLPADDKNPFADGGYHDDLVLWLAYREAREMLKAAGDAP